MTRTSFKHRVRNGPPGHAYIYMIHGRWIFSVVCQPEGVQEVVHIRALEPLVGVDLMMQRRGTDDIRNLCSGPGKVGQAMGIDGTLYGADVVTSELRIVEGKEISDLVQTTRIGISQGVDLPYRFYSREHVKWVSRR
jgi:DNA-3-methyladenine glycosylase